MKIHSNYLALLNNSPFRLMLLLLALAAARLNGQEQFLIPDGQVQTVQALEERYQDFIVPDNLNGFDRLIIEAEGADGGWVEYTYYDRFRTKRNKRVNGGEGATVSAAYSVGGVGGQIPAGAILRFVIGNRGQWAKFDLLDTGNFGAGGGGGTAVLLSKDRGVSWQLLMVAGGGGGAGIRYQDDQKEMELNPGQPASSEEAGIGGTHFKFLMAEGGNRGEGGHSQNNNGGGGGAFGDGHHDEGALHYGNAGWKDYKLSGLPLGGLGGTHHDRYDGGWGFGGGGSGMEGGGGGGGYSGGGSGMDGYGGGGGGSFVDVISMHPATVSKIQNENTNNPGDGFIRYKFSRGF